MPALLVYTKKEEAEVWWDTIQQGLQSFFSENEVVTPQRFMEIYNASYALETSNWKKFLSPGIENGHIVRTRVCEFLRYIADQLADEAPPGADLSRWYTAEYNRFIKSWEKASRIFAYHDRHFVRRQKEAPTKGLNDDNAQDTTLTMFELGRQVWVKSGTEYLIQQARLPADIAEKLDTIT